MIMDGLDDAIIGHSQTPTGEVRIVYEEGKIIESLMKEMTSEEAWEWYSFNIACAYISEIQPLIIKI
jgi:hypothetical protein